jgi:chromosome segregation ATPase
MEQIINDLKSALAGMNEQADKFAKKSANLDILIDDSRKKVSVIIARENAVSEKERFYANYDTVEKIRADAKAERVALGKDKADFEAEKKAVMADKAIVAEAKETLAKTIAMYKSKIESCDREIKKLEEDRKQLEAKIIDNFAKNLTKK